MQRMQTGLVAVAIMLAIAAIYLLIPTADYNGDGLGYANIVETATSTQLWAVGARLLYCPTGRLIASFLELFGWQGRVVHLFVVFNSLIGALGAGIFFLTGYRVTRNLYLSAAVTLGLAFSLSYWFWNINATSYPTNVFFLICLLYLIVRLMEAPGRSRYLLLCALIGLAHALACMYWLTSVLLGPSLALIVFMAVRQQKISERVVGVVVYGACFVLFAIVPLAAAAMQTSNVTTFSGFTAWLSAASYGIPPKLSIANTFRGLIGFSSSIFGLIEIGPYIKNALWGVPNVLDNKTRLVSEFVAFLWLWAAVASTVVLYLRSRKSISAHNNRLLLILLIWAAPIVCFGMVWLGSDTERWLAVSPVFWFLILLIVSEAGARVSQAVNRKIGIAVTVFAASVGLYNLVMVTVPRSNPDNNLPMKAAVALDAQMGPEDFVMLWGHDQLFIGPDLGYFYRKKSMHVNTNGKHNAVDLEKQLTEKIDQTQAQHGRVLVVGRLFLPEDLPESRYAETEQRVDRKAVAAILSNWEQQPAFTYGGETYWELTTRRASGPAH